jgi:hypothetical protein|tara:strand:+ start:320 stop:484 length:165 start_codon:yes stop_codon:yes gene_type:complete
MTDNKKFDRFVNYMYGEYQLEKQQYEEKPLSRQAYEASFKDYLERKFNSMVEAE